MKLFIATDHRGVEYKKEIINLLKDEYDIIDASPDNYPTDDYPDFAFRVGKLVNENKGSLGILICGTGIGMCIAANKVKNIRCALVANAYDAEYARYHDDANVIALSSKIEPKLASDFIRIFTKTSLCKEEKYGRRVKKVLDYERGEYNEL